MSTVNTWVGKHQGQITSREAAFKDGAAVRKNGYELVLNKFRLEF